jgi:hypothetical protein
VVGILMYVIFTALKKAPETRDAASVAPMP